MSQAATRHGPEVQLLEQAARWPSADFAGLLEEGASPPYAHGS